MAKLGIVKQITKADLGGSEFPAWLDPFLAALNLFIGSVGRALQGRLTFEDNFLATVKDLKFTSGTELKVNPESGRLSVTGILPLSSEKAVTSFLWTPKDDGSVGVTFTFSGGGESTCKILILLG